MLDLHDEPSAENEFYFQWHITEKCNLRCEHCYHDGYTSANELNLDQLFQVADNMDDALRSWKRAGTLSVTGGEPLVVREKLVPLLEHLDRKVTVSYYDLLTNGSLIDGDILTRLRALKRLRRIQLSLEAADEDLNDRIRGGGSFRKTLSAIRMLKKNGFQVAVMMTLSRINMDGIEPLIDLLMDEGVDTFAAERFVPEGSGKGMQDAFLTPHEIKDAFEIIYSVAVRNGRPRVLLYRPLFALLNSEDETVGALCSVGNNALTIMHDGTIFPCRRLPIPIGNALTDTFYKVWYTSELLWKIRDARNIKGKCGECHLIPVCRGCRAMAYAVNGDYLGEDPQCWK